MLTRVRRTYSTSPVENSLITNLHQSEFLANQRRAPAAVLNVLLLVYVIAVNVPSWLGNTPHTRDSLLPRLSVSMLTSFPLNAGVAEQKTCCIVKRNPRRHVHTPQAGYLTPDHCRVTRSIALRSVGRGGFMDTIYKLKFNWSTCLLLNL